MSIASSYVIQADYIIEQLIMKIEKMEKGEGILANIKKLVEELKKEKLSIHSYEHEFIKKFETEMEKNNTKKCQHKKIIKKDFDDFETTYCEECNRLTICIMQEDLNAKNVEKEYN